MKSGDLGFDQSLNRANFIGTFIYITAAIILLSACAQEPAPYYAPTPSTFDRAWSAAINAAQDEGVRIVSEDRVSGTIKGGRGQQEITIYVRTQADGNVRLEFSVRGPKGGRSRPGGSNIKSLRPAYGAIGPAFVVSHYGKVYENDPRRKHRLIAGAIEEPNPDESWTEIK